MNTAPVFQCSETESGYDPDRVLGKWYFFNEVWSDTYGPYDTEDICREALLQYCETNL